MFNDRTAREMSTKPAAVSVIIIFLVAGELFSYLPASGTMYLGRGDGTTCFVSYQLPLCLLTHDLYVENSKSSIACKNQVKTARPELKTTEIAKVLGERWGKMDAEARAPYTEKANRDKERRVDMKINWCRYLTTPMFYFSPLDNGVRSCSRTQ